MFEVTIKRKFKFKDKPVFEVGEQVEMTEKEVKAIQRQLGGDFIEAVEKKVEVNLEEKTVAELQELLNEKEIEFAPKATKKDLIKLIEENKEKE